MAISLKDKPVPLKDVYPWVNGRSEGLGPKSIDIVVCEMEYNLLVPLITLLY